MNVAKAFLREARRCPEKSAIITAGRTISYGELAALSGALACRYRDQGVNQGDAVLLAHSVGIELFASIVALFRLGAPIMLPDVSAGLPGARQALAVVPARGLAGGWKAQLAKRFVPFLRRIPLSLSARPGKYTDDGTCEALPADWPALITFTSGSTGRPKGIERSHSFLIRQHTLVTDMLGPEADDIDLISLPVFVLSNLGNGVTSVIPEGDLRRPGDMAGDKIVQQILKERVNRILAPPALCERLCDTRASLPQIRKIFTGGGPVFPDLLHRLQRLAPEAEITSVYGSTEAEPIAHVALSQLREADFAAMAAGEGLLAGRPINQIRLQIIQDEITVTGDHVVKGYIDPADDVETKQNIDGEIWHRTGDAGRLDSQGRLWLLGRAAAGRNGVYPFTLETAARSITGVDQAAVLLDTDPATLAVSLSPNADAADIQNQLNQRLPNLKTFVLPTIPMDKRHNSKVNHAALKAKLGIV